MATRAAPPRGFGLPASEIVLVVILGRTQRFYGATAIFDLS